MPVFLHGSRGGQYFLPRVTGGQKQLMTCDTIPDFKGKIEMKLSIELSFYSRRCLMGIICIYLMIYFLQCMSKA